MTGIGVLAAACQSAPPAPTAAPGKPAAAASPPASGPAAAPSPVASPAAASSSAVAKPAIDPSLASVWQGKTVNMLIGQPPGGGHDAWARLVARHLGKYLPGNPTVVALNVPGAVSVLATNQVYESKPDGLTIGEVSADIPTFQLQSGENRDAIRYDAAKVSWLGSAASTTWLLFVHARSGVTKLQDLREKSLKLGEQAPGSVTHRLNIVLKEALGWPTGKAVFGYTGTREIVLGVDRGEVDLVYLPWDTALQQKGDDIRAKQLLPLVVFGPKVSDPLLAGVPTGAEVFASASADAKQLLALTERPLSWFRPFISSPGLPPDVLATLRGALTATMADADLKKEADGLKFDIDHIPGERLQQLVAEYMQTPPALVERLDKIVKDDTPA